MRKRFYNTVLLIGSAITLAFALLSAFEDNYFREWRRMQRTYADMVKGRIPFNGGLKQFYLPDLNRIDRCTTCHVGLLNQDMKDATEPFTTHPGTYLSSHQPQEMGCTLCHAGQGLATNSLEAHANAPEQRVFWDEPIYSRDFVQASCRTCHSSEWAGSNGAPLLAAGARLFVENGCNSCHKTAGVGGSRGPRLDGIGSQPHAHFSMAHLEEPHTVEHWQEEHLKDPQKVVPGSAMRKYDFNNAEAHALAIYLASLRDVRVPERMVHSRDSLDRERPDGKLLYQRYCSGCHGEGLKDRKDEVLGWRVPAIRNPAMLALAGPEFIRKTIYNGRAGTPMESMGPASSGLSTREIDALVGYIYSSAAKKRPAPWTFVDEDDEVSVDEGKDLYDDSCKMCHGEKGEGGEKGLRLTAKILTEMPDEFLLITVRDGRPGTTMPSAREESEFEDYEIASIVAYVRQLQRQALEGTN